MNQEKSSGDEKETVKSETSKTIRMFLLEIGCMLFASLGIYLLEFTGLIGQETDYLLMYIVFSVLGIAVTGFNLRYAAIRGELDYDNGEHLERFWLCFALGLVVAFVCTFLPVAAWPFLPVYVLLGLFGSLDTGILGATLLLSIPACMAGAGAEVFVMYLISGVFGVTMFKRLQEGVDGFRTGIPFFVSMGGLLVCETAGTVLVRNAKPSFELFVLPAANLLVSGVLLVGIMKFFSEKVVYRYRVNYLDLYDTENEILAALKQEDKGTYMKSVHTVHFAERIAKQLEMNVESLKCAGYYYGMGEKLAELFTAYPFPPDAVMILEEYQDKGKPVRHRETAVLVITEKVISTILQLQGEGSDVNYDEVIDGIFEQFRAEGTFGQCDISMRDMETMRKIFKEEKLYYDFLR